MPQGAGVVVLHRSDAFGLVAGPYASRVILGRIGCGKPAGERDWATVTSLGWWPIRKASDFGATSDWALTQPNLDFWELVQSLQTPRVCVAYHSPSGVVLTLH